MLPLLVVLAAPQLTIPGAGDVNGETIADAGEPLTIRWSNRSWVELPVFRY